MTKKEIAQLAQASYTKDELDARKVEKIVSLLSRAEIKLYIRGLKLIEKTKTISLVLPNLNLYNKSLLGLVKKRVTVTEDASLLMGAKIIDNDMVYDMSLKNSLDEFLSGV